MKSEGLAGLTTVSVDWEEPAVIILDQTQLPNREAYLRLYTPEEIWEAIYHLKVRGAPAIGVAAAYGMAVCAQQFGEQSFSVFFQKPSQNQKVKKYLASSRPTAVNLFMALDRMEKCVLSLQDQQVDTIKIKLQQEAEAIRAEDAAACRSIGEWGLSVLQPGMGLLTHCNAGHLAVSAYGTALAPVYLGQERGYHFKVYADETRPLLQGARLTAFELQKAGVDVTLICDNMASIVMKNGWIDAVVVGCDRMAANGDGANKIGTSGVAILAKEYGIPFYMFVPTSTIDMNTATGDDIHIEQRKGEEIYKMWYEKDMAPEGVKTYNPSFDVTDHKYITAVITEKGIVRPPYDVNLKKMMEEK